MLRLASTFSDTQSDHLLAAIAGIVFLGAPLRGTGYGNIIAAIKSMASATTGISEDDVVLAELLGGDEHLHENESLARLGCEAFEKVWMDFNFRVKTFSETMMQDSRRSWAEWGVVSIPPSPYSPPGPRIFAFPSYPSSFVFFLSRFSPVPDSPLALSSLQGAKGWVLSVATGSEG